MTASQPLRVSLGTAPSSHLIGVAFSALTAASLAIERDIARTSCVRASAAAIAPPTNPEAPVMKIRRATSSRPVVRCELSVLRRGSYLTPASAHNGQRKTGNSRLHSPIYIIRVANLKDLWRPTSFFIVPPLSIPAPEFEPAMLPSIESRIAAELSVKPEQVAAAVALLDEGATVPFIARYRKEVTSGLDDTQLRTLEERLAYLRELEERRAAILASIDEQKKLTPELRAAIEAAEAKQRLEDLYLPYKPKRRTKAQIAREAGLDGLAAALLADRSLKPETEAAKYLKSAFTGEHGENPGVPDAKAALEGARAILIEQFAEDAELLANLRAHLHDQGVLVSTLIEGKEEAAAKFRDYFAYSEPIRAIPSHRALALFRGRKEELLKVTLKLPEELATDASPEPKFNACELKIAARFAIVDRGRPADAWLLQTVRWTWQVKLAWQLEAELLTELRERSEEEAIRVFARNLHDLLLAAPAGPRATMGLDPGLRTGVKVAVVDRTGKVLETATVYPHAPRNDWDRALRRWPCSRRSTTST